MPPRGKRRAPAPWLGIVDVAQELSTTEYAVLGVLAEGPNHGFALSKLLDADSEVGRVFKVRRPLVYRALDRLVDAGFAEPISTEKGNAGPKRVIHRITRRGRSQIRRWLNDPVEHVRDIRIEFLLKLALIDRAGRSPVDLIRRQATVLTPTLESIDESTTDKRDHVELWRRHNAAAAMAYLDTLERLHTRSAD
jgi:DNA-binding PadR family transcriptional regulator